MQTHTNLSPTPMVPPYLPSDLLEEAAGDDGQQQQTYVEPQVLVSREGKRKQKVSQTATMLKHNVRRKKKTNSQVEYLKLLFHKLGGEWDGKIRKEAMQKTGLSRIQIYKWFFDMKL